MIGIVVFLMLNFLLCAVYFVCVQRPVFMMVNRHTAARAVTVADYRAVTAGGLKLDLSASAYLTAIPLLTIWVCMHIPGYPVRIPLMAAMSVCALVMSLITVFDTILYGPWRFRIDCSVLAYLRSPKGAMASVSPMFVMGALGGVVALAAALFAAMYGIATVSGVFNADIHNTAVGDHLITAAVMLVCAAVTFAFIRGLKHRPNSPFMVYGFTDMYFNHAGVNPLFNFIFSLSMRKKDSKQYIVYDKAEVEREMDRLLPRTGVPQVSLLKTQRPRLVLFVIWESLCEHFTGAIGGRGITEHFDRLSKEGVLFTRVDAGSYRTDPAMICTLSGYPGHPVHSIMRNTHALTTLPSIPHTLKRHGYSASVIHGGNLSILHLIDYFLASGHERVVSVDDMPSDAPRGAWGVHDNYMFDYLLDDLKAHATDPEPRFVTFLTLSSHQPFKVPYRKHDDDIDNSYAFTDEAFGKFIDSLKETDMWDDALVVVLGDHGIGTTFLSQPRDVQPHIPVLLLGGAIKAPQRIDTVMSQTDLAATLLGQMGIDHDDFPFSRDVLADTYTEPFAVHSYNNGFLCRDERGYTDYDHVSHRAVTGADERRERLGAMYVQRLIMDLAER